MIMLPERQSSQWYEINKLKLTISCLKNLIFKFLAAKTINKNPKPMIIIPMAILKSTKPLFLSVYGPKPATPVAKV
jgi:hypothetical protein